MVVTAVKQAEDGEDLIVRFYETAGRPSTVRLTFHAAPRAAWRCNLLEEKGESLAVQGRSVFVPTRGYSIETIKAGFR